MDEALKKLPQETRKVFESIILFWSKDDPSGLFEVRRAQLAKKLDISEKTLQRRTNELEAAGLIEKQTRTAYIRLTPAALVSIHAPAKGATPAPPKPPAQRQTVPAPEPQAQAEAARLETPAPAPEAVSSHAPAPAERVIKINLGLPKSLHRKVKIFAMDRELTMVNAIILLVDKGLESY